jgi:hypothetical protein
VTFTALSSDGSGTCKSTQGFGMLIDGSIYTKWCVKYGSLPLYIIFRSSEPIKVNGYTITTGNDNVSCPGRNPGSWTLYGSNDLSNWTIIDTVVNDSKLQDVNYGSYEYSCATSAGYVYFKFEISALSSSNTDGVMQMSELSLNYSASVVDTSVVSSSSGNSLAQSVPFSCDLIPYSVDVVEVAGGFYSPDWIKSVSSFSGSDAVFSGVSSDAVSISSSNGSRAFDICVLNPAYSCSFDMNTEYLNFSLSLAFSSGYPSSDLYLVASNSSTLFTSLSEYNKAAIRLDYSVSENYLYSSSVSYLTYSGSVFIGYPLTDVNGDSIGSKSASRNVIPSSKYLHFLFVINDASASLANSVLPDGVPCVSFSGSFTSFVTLSSGKLSEAVSTIESDISSLKTFINNRIYSVESSLSDFIDYEKTYNAALSAYQEACYSSLVTYLAWLTESVGDISTSLGDVSDLVTSSNKYTLAVYQMLDDYVYTSYDYLYKIFQALEGLESIDYSGIFSLLYQISGDIDTLTNLVSMVEDNLLEGIESVDTKVENFSSAFNVFSASQESVNNDVLEYLAAIKTSSADTYEWVYLSYLYNERYYSDIMESIDNYGQSLTSTLSSDYTALSTQLDTIQVLVENLDNSSNNTTVEQSETKEYMYDEVNNYLDESSYTSDSTTLSDNLLDGFGGLDTAFSSDLPSSLLSSSTGYRALLAATLPSVFNIGDGFVYSLFLFAVLAFVIILIYRRL